MHPLKRFSKRVQRGLRNIAYRVFTFINNQGIQSQDLRVVKIITKDARKTPNRT